MYQALSPLLKGPGDEASGPSAIPISATQLTSRALDISRQQWVHALISLTPSRLDLTFLLSLEEKDHLFTQSLSFPVDGDGDGDNIVSPSPVSPQVGYTLQTTTLLMLCLQYHRMPTYS